MSEDALVAAIAKLATDPAAPKLALGIGDDAAAWQPSRSHRSVVTSDVLIEGVHFTFEAMSPYDAGWRSMAANVSDLAAMGARPVLATVALGAAASLGEDALLELYRGIADAAKRWKIAIAGGDLSRAQATTVAITAIGEVRATELKRRSGGRPGQVVAVTGPLGTSRAGLELTRRPGVLTGELAEEASHAFRRPEARVAEGRFLAASRNVGAMMDCSDGLSTDLDRLCVASGCGATVEGVPVAAAARAFAEKSGEDPERFALSGGEDFELIVTVRERAFDYLAKRFRARFGRELQRVGRLRAGTGVDFRGESLARTGWDHFA